MYLKVIYNLSVWYSCQEHSFVQPEIELSEIVSVVYIYLALDDKAGDPHVSLQSKAADGVTSSAFYIASVTSHHE